ncbi:MAG: 2-oxoacid:acceptor oxidoreductase family protein, partial [Patescibacteria group bacterium]
MSTLWKIGGEAGFGIMTTGLTFSKIASRSGYHIFDYVEYPSLIRGGHNAIDVVFSKDPVHTLKEEIDILVCLNKQTYTYHNDKLAENALVMYDPEEFEPDKKGIKISVPFKKILKELQGAMIMKNTIALGATLALIEGDMEMLYSILSKQFAKKGEKVVEFNKQFAKQGHDHVFTNHKEH